MKLGSQYKTMVIIAALFLGVASASEFPGNSIYQLESNWQTQNSDVVKLSTMADQVQIVAFVYTYCEHTCPIIVAKLKSIAEDIPNSLKEQTHITLITLDPARDTPEKLKQYMQKQDLDETQWTMLQGDADSTRDLAAVLGTRYRPMGKDDIAHSNTLTVLSQTGVVEFQSKGVSEPIDNIIDAIEKAHN